MNNPNLFLIVIAAAIVWQINNSKRLAVEDGQRGIQAWAFSLIIAVGIFICIANGVILYAAIGAVIEALINIFLVFINQENKRKNSREKKTKLGLVVSTFIAVLIPGLIFSLSELYIRLI